MSQDNSGYGGAHQWPDAWVHTEAGKVFPGVDIAEALVTGLGRSGSPAGEMSMFESRLKRGEFGHISEQDHSSGQWWSAGSGGDAFPAGPATARTHRGEFTSPALFTLSTLNAER